MPGSSPRSTITTDDGGCLASRIDSSTRCLYGTALPPRMPASAVTITFGFASSMRVARLAAANPPNTTECTAPMRAQASIAKAASAIIGM